MPACEPVECQRARLLVGVIGPRVTAVDVAAELVEHDDQRDAAACTRGPLVELPGFGGGECGFEALADLSVEPGVLAPPQCVGAGVIGRKPKFQDVVGSAHPGTLANLRGECKLCWPT